MRAAQEKGDSWAASFKVTTTTIQVKRGKESTYEPDVSFFRQGIRNPNRWERIEPPNLA